jgi:hypothetical protein
MKRKQTAGLNPTAVRLQLHLLLRNGGFGITNFPPDVFAAAFLSSHWEEPKTYNHSIKTTLSHNIHGVNIESI